MSKGGFKHSAETKLKMSIASKGSHNSMHGKTTSLETKAKISASLKGHPVSAETRAKISAGNLGKTRSLEARTKMSRAALGRVRSAMAVAKHSASTTGEKHWSWQVNRNKKQYGSGFNSQMKDAIRWLWHGHCAVCGHLSNRELDIHHIDYDKNNNSPNNLIPLCRCCHGKTYGGSATRARWVDFFQSPAAFQP